STLEQRTTAAASPAATIALVAARAPSFAEVWILDVAPIWHAEVGGIPPVPADAGVGRAPHWRPWRGETVTVPVTRPGGTEGQTLTIERAELTVRPGARSTSTSLTAELHASRGGPHVITLPTSATLESLRLDGIEQPLRADGGRVTLALK